VAALITAIAVSGSRKSDGTANASGRVYLYSPGTTTVVPGYMDESLSQAHTTVSGGIALNAAGKAKIWVNDPVDVVVQDSSGTTVDTFLGFNRTRAEQVEVENAGFTGALTDANGAVSQGAGGKTSLGAILTLLAASVNGPDGKYKESAGATARLLADFLRDVWISVKDFGAVGNGIADDTTAIQNAINRVKARGAGTIYFPNGTYQASALALASATGVSFKGDGLSSSIVRNTSASANLLTLTTCTGFAIRDLGFSAVTTSTGSAVAMSDCSSLMLDSVSIASHRFGADFSAGCNVTALRNAVISTDSNAASRAVRYNLTGGSVSGHSIVGGSLAAGSGACVEYNGAVSRTAISGGVTFSQSTATAVLFNASLTGTRHSVIGCPSIGGAGSATSFDLSGLSTSPIFYQAGNGIDGYAVSQASGGGGGSNHTPNLARGREIHIRLTSGGAAVCTINAPTPTPSTSERDVSIRFRLTAAAGGNITWTFPAVYVLVGGGTTIVGTDGNTDIVEFMWDAQTSEYRECFRSATLT
jgi:hypothetical protein